MSLFTITGRVGKDAELRTTTKGTKVCQFSLAETRGWGDRKETVWVKCTLFGDRAEKLAPHIVKGGVVEAWGKVSASAFKGKDGEPRASLDLSVTDLEFHGGPRRDDGPVMDRTRAGRDDPEDSIPF